MEAVVTSPVELDEPRSGLDQALPPPWVTLVWNDPVNLMSYVTYVLMQLFDHSRAVAEQMMMDVHHKGRAAVSSGTREQMEHDVSRLHAKGLWATLQQD